VAELERELRALAAAVELPAEPELASRVRTRLTAPPRRRPWRPIAIALATAAVALGAAFAVPDSRSVILCFLGLKGVTVIEVGDLPRVGPGGLAFGDRTTLATAERRLGFTPLLPRLGKPDAVYVDLDAGYLILLYEGRIRLSEFVAGGPILEKLTKFTSGVESLTVNGGRGLWVPAGHVVFELGRQPRLAANTLLWEQGDLTIRLEGRLTKARALEIAKTVR
jgi:hypothetical protein